MKRQQDIQRILEDFKHPRNHICKEKSAHHQDKERKGKTITSRKGIANVFGEIYKKLNDDNEQEETEREIGENENESSIDVHYNNVNEMMPRDHDRRVANCNQQTQKKRKSPDSNGIRAEDIKACDDETREMVREIFNEIIKQNEFTPEAWKKVKIKVIYK